MPARIWLLPSIGALILGYSTWNSVQGCCPAHPSGKPAVNADQTVILIWDAASKTEHFIRQASFKSESDDFGFLVPTPNPPELEETGNEAFAFLLKLTEPERKKAFRPISGIGCSSLVYNLDTTQTYMSHVRILDEKLVAGFNAVVLESNSTSALVSWLNANGYAFSPEVEAWAKPYVEAGWKITALKIAKDKDRQEDKTVNASALRMTFKTDRPPFPYREPNSNKYANQLGARDRLLRIYFIGEARYQGELTAEVPWTGRVAWAGRLKEKDRKKTLDLLKLADRFVPSKWWLTEFEDPWPYQVAPADLYFSPSPIQDEVRRMPIVQYVSRPFPTDMMAYALGAVVILPSLLRRIRRTPNHRPSLNFPGTKADDR
jgi:hypothetical protein